MKLNYGLIRVSSSSQKDNTSLSHQRKSILGYCKYHQIDLEDMFEEVMTGTHSNRFGLNRIRDLVYDDKVAAVVVFKLDRLMRSFSEGVRFIEFLVENGVTIISVHENLDTSSISGRFFINILLSMSEMERDTIVERMAFGKLSRFHNHQRPAGRISYGYKKSDNGLDVDPEESKIIKYIFNKYVELTRKGMSKIRRMRKLRSLLNGHGYRYKDEEFRAHTLNYILKNGFYVGDMTFGSMVGKHQYVRIISRRLFNLVNQ